MVKIICTNINNPHTSNYGEYIYMNHGYLNIGTIYEGEYSKHERYYGCKGYYIGIDAYGHKQWFPEECFISLSEWRDKKIDEILE